jgi:hypothetical protein
VAPPPEKATAPVDGSTTSIIAAAWRVQQQPRLRECRR